MTLDRAYFDAMYAADADPWGFTERWYEHRKYALSVAALILLTFAAMFPLLVFELEGREQAGGILSSAAALWDVGYPVLAVLVFFTVLAAPLLKILATLYVVLPLLAGRPAPGTARVFRMLDHLKPWAMVEVFLLGLIVAYVKLSDIATVEIGPSLVALVGLMVAMTWAEAALDPYDVWERLSPQLRQGAADIAPERLVRCHACAQLAEGEHRPCPRCGAPLHRRKPGSVHTTRGLAEPRRAEGAQPDDRPARVQRPAAAAVRRRQRHVRIPEPLSSLRRVLINAARAQDHDARRDRKRTGLCALDPEV